MSGGRPVIIGTAGHIDHGKTALVKALTGRDTDRLPEERRRGISIDLGFAELDLGGGRAASLIDVPGHERFVRTMVAGATGIDCFLLAIAADDGPMPQTREHLAVLRALGVERGVVALTRCDLTSSERIAAHRSEAAALAPGLPIVESSMRTGAGIEKLRGAIATAASAALHRRCGAGPDAPPVLHIDRAFTLRGHGTIVTGTLWTGTIEPGDRVLVLPRAFEARVRSVQSHDRALDRAVAHTRVALNLAGVGTDDVARGDVVTAATGGPVPTWRLEVELAGVSAGELDGARVQVHHGTRDTPARVVAPPGVGFTQLRLEQPLLALAGDRFVIRSIAPPDTLGGGVITHVAPPRRGRAPVREDDGERSRDQAQAAVGARSKPLSLDQDAIKVLTVLRRTGARTPSVPDLAAAIGLDEQETRERLRVLREAGQVCEAGRGVWFATEALQALESRVVDIARAKGSISLAVARDQLRTNRRCAQAILERLGGRELIRDGERHRPRR